MPKLATLVLLAGIAAPALAEGRAITQRVTVEQLEQAIAHAHRGRDGPLAKRISNLKLSERLSAARLLRLENELPGAQSRGALSALADESAFLDLPAAEIPSRPAPDPAAQAILLGLSVDYVKTAIARWPNFIATRKTTRFEGTATVIAADLQDELFSFELWRAPSAVNWDCPGQPKVGYRRLSVIDRSSVTVVYRNGHELHALDEKGGEFECPVNAVSTTEEFGEVLAWVPKVVTQGKVAWSHWEQGPAGLLAVFRYSALVSFKMPLEVEADGEIALNPADGSIRRLTEIRRWTEHEPGPGPKGGYDANVEYDTAVEYGPVNIGGTICICPVKRVAIYLAPMLWPRGWNDLDDQAYRRFGISESPLQEYLNDVTFTQYRLYGSSE
ncbi:MAG: hypothetical protein WBE72_18270 [Terracidiphilus sp.]